MGMECDTAGVFGEADWMANFGVSLNFSALFARCKYTLCGQLLLAEV